MKYTVICDYKIFEKHFREIERERERERESRNDEPLMYH